MLETQRLEELPLPDNGIDEGIANLVRTVVLIGVPTNASCEGHLDSDHHCHPWVGIKFPESPAAQRLRSLVETYNETHGTQWEIKQPPKDPDWPLPPVFGELQPLTPGKRIFVVVWGKRGGLRYRAI